MEASLSYAVINQVDTPRETKLDYCQILLEKVDERKVIFLSASYLLVAVIIYALDISTLLI